MNRFIDIIAYIIYYAVMTVAIIILGPPFLILILPNMIFEWAEIRLGKKSGYD